MANSKKPTKINRVKGTQDSSKPRDFDPWVFFTSGTAHGPQSLDRRKTPRQGRRQDQRLRPRPALRRRSVRGHSRLLGADLQDGAAPAAAVGFGQGDPAS